MNQTAAVPRARRHGWRRRFRHSLGMRLVALFVVLAFALTLTFVAGMQKALAGGWREVVRPLVADYVDRLAADLGSPPDVARAQALVQRLPLSIRIEGPVVQWDSHPQRRNRGWQRNGDEQDQDGYWWLLTRSTADGHRIHFGLGDAGWQRSPRFIGWATLAVLLLLTALAYAYVRRLLRPLHDIRRGAVRFGQGDFSRPITPRRDDELGDLAGQVNQMASSLHGMLDAKRALLLAISHELRSPLTRARLNAELVADTADNREPRQALLRDLSEMRDLVTDLLESERLASGHAALQSERTDLNRLVTDVVAAHFEGRGVRTELAAGLPLLPLDGMRIKLLLRNLIDNALRHGGEAAQPPMVMTSSDGKAVMLTVRDFGPGVAPEHLPKLADAFYRVDAARQRSTGGVGLGLHLCRLVAQAHGGSMEVRNAQPGLAVEVTLLVHKETPGRPKFP
jgi:signal transduction histidine kinase